MIYLTCPHCARVIAKSGRTHIPACSPEGREARRVRAIGFARRYRERTRPKRTQIFRGWTIPPEYLSRAGDLDACPECAGPKTKHAAMCIACRRARGRRIRPLADRFWSKVDRSADCWLWTGARTPTGYGALHGQERLAPRMAWTLSVGPIPMGLQVLHRCDNPPCVNPDHLWLGTQQDNMADMIAKGRAAWQKPN